MIQQTSLFAYQDVQVNLTDRQRHVYQGMRMMNRNFTDKELALFLDMPINEVTPRRGELVRKGLVREGGKRICTAPRSSTTRPVMSWEVGILL